MVERSELITICRQIGGMMDAGVDILRITKVLRAQTENPRLLAFYDELDHDLTMGVSLPDALGRAPDLFSPFAISLVRESEDPLGRSGQGIGSAFMRIADFLQKEEETAHDGWGHGEPVAAAAPIIAAQEHAAHIANYSLLTVSALDGLIDHIQLIALRSLTILSGLFLALGSVWASVELGLLDRHWLNLTLCSVGALFIGGAGIWVRRSIEAERKRGARCSFCGRNARQGVQLRQAARYAGASICTDCASTISGRAPVALGNGYSSNLAVTMPEPRRATVVQATVTTPAFDEDESVWQTDGPPQNRIISATGPQVNEEATIGDDPVADAPRRERSHGRRARRVTTPGREANYE